jgi:hypothetical protein
MKFTAPLRTPAKNTEQRIFKFALFVVLPLMAILTVYSFASINSKKNDTAYNMISTQSGNASKRITIFSDPIHRDLRYLQARGNTKKQLDPENPEDVRDFLGRFSEFYLQNVKQVLFFDGKTTWIYTINEGGCTGPDEVINFSHEKSLEETLQTTTSEKIDWYPGAIDEECQTSSILAAMRFTDPKSQQPYTVAMDVDTSDFFAGLEKYKHGHLFLVSDLPGRLPQQFLLDDARKPDIDETNEPVILAAYTRWKKNAVKKNESIFRMVFNGKPWWVSIRPLEIKGRDLYSGYILAENNMLSELIKTRRNFAIISLISFAIVLVATVFLWRRYQRDIAQSALPPFVNKMTDNEVLHTISAGEDDRLEFKSTLRWNLRTNKPDKAMEIACLKTIAAFLNSEGGTLLVGVEDSGNILGIGADQFPNEDKFLLHFNNLINQHLGLETADCFSFDIRHLESGDIMIVDCLPSPAPVYVTHDRKEEFYVRVGPGTRPLTTRDAMEYIRNHF